jgi:4-alpha-glucanotransferase
MVNTRNSPFQEKGWMDARRSGLLLHISSLPSAFGIGDMGPSAFRFADLLFEARQSFWQILPINPTSTALCNSPYSSDSAFAGNPLLISPEILKKEGFVSKSDLSSLSPLPEERVDYEAAALLKRKILKIAFERNRSSLESEREFIDFCGNQFCWLEDYALFKALKESSGGAPWNRFQEGVMNRSPVLLVQIRDQFKEQILFEQFIQFIFFKQWDALKKYCNRKNILMIGDIPIYVLYDSAEVWTNPSLFHLDHQRRPWIVAGVPPDYFSTTGQLWGNPLYNWEEMKGTNYSWWVQRLSHNLRLFDLVRLDHFRGFLAYWQVPAGRTTAEHGEWAPAPGEDFFNVVFGHFPNPSIIAEDLGIITPDVTDLMRKFHIPGMKVLLFAFGDDLPTHPFLPHNYIKNCVVYSGTHDTNTIRGWFRKEAGLKQKERLSAYLGHGVNKDSIHLDLTRLAMMSVANSVILPMQDVLGLGEEARMNLPGSRAENWEWRLLPDQMTPSVFEPLAEMTRIYGRTG